tara:strand:+ start:776 stop:1072 length:297 start_codon:yes stop_codon:yes gene_type:complete
MKRKEHLLKTEDEAFQAVNKMGLFEFQYSTDGMICYRQAATLMDDIGIHQFEVTFFKNDNHPFFRIDSASDFLNFHEILEIVIISDNCNSNRETVYNK